MRLITRWSWLFDIECCRCFSNSCNIRVSSGKGWSWSWIRFGWWWWWWWRRRQYAFNINVDKYWLCFSYWYTHQAVCPSDRPTDQPSIRLTSSVSHLGSVGRWYNHYVMRFLGYFFLQWNCIFLTHTHFKLNTLKDVIHETTG